MTESTFQRALDADPYSSAIRFVFADWLEDRGDWRAAGYRWMADHGRSPVPCTASEMITTWDWWCQLDPDQPRRAAGHIHDACWVRLDLFNRLRDYRFKSSWSGGVAYKEYPDRRTAEEALCRAVAAVRAAVGVAG